MLKRLLILIILCCSVVVSFAQDGIQLEDSIAQSRQNRTAPFSSLESEVASENFNDSYRSVEYKNRFKLTPFSDPQINFLPGLPSIFAGDINGDGKNDIVGPYNGTTIANERTERLEDLTSKTLVFFGGNTSTEHDQLLYTFIVPVGDLNADGYDDAIANNSENGLNYYFGSSGGYVKDEVSFVDTLSSYIMGFKDFNGDGYEDFMASQRFDGNNKFQIIFGGETKEDFIGKNYEIDNFSYVIASSQDTDMLTTIAFVLDFNGTTFFNRVELSNLKVLPDDLSLQKVNSHTLSVNHPASLGSRRPIKLIDTDGDGLEEIYIPELIRGSSVSTSLILHATDEGYDSLTTLQYFSSNGPLNPIGDIDGDGRTDYVRTRDKSLEISYGPTEFIDQFPGVMPEPLLTLENFRPLYSDNFYSTFPPFYGIGDFNGDGVDDFNIILSSSSEIGQRIYYGNTERNSDSFQDILYNRNEFQRSPSFIESANMGDMNSDGFEDLALLYKDRTEVFYGGSFKETPDFTIPTSGDRNVSLEAGDYNGDSLRDLIIVSSFDVDNSAFGHSFENKLEIFFGGGNFGSQSAKTIDKADIGAENVRSGGYDVTNIGDFNNDGKDDFIVTFLKLGKLLMYYGSDDISSSPDLTFDDFNSDFGIDGLLSSSAISFGYRVQGIGDINGDDIDDFAVGDFMNILKFQEVRNFNTGAVLLFYGSEHSPGELGSREPNEVLILNEERFQNYRYFGYHLTGGDFNGDGFGDLLVSTEGTSRTNRTPTPEEGKDAVFIYHGGPSFDTQYDQLFGLPGDVFNNHEINSVSTNAGEILTVKDINGDGADEILFSSHNKGFNSTISNAALVLGGESISNDKIPDIRFIAPNQLISLGTFGNFINIEFNSTIGDFDGDGIPEIVLHQEDFVNYRQSIVYTYPIENPNKDTQTIDFTATEQVAFTPIPFIPEATASSTLPVSFEVISGPAIISEGSLTLTGIGTVVIEASQSGNGVFNRAPLIRKTITVTKADQLIQFNDIEDKTFGDAPLELTATSHSGLDVIYSIESGPATVEGNTLTMTGAGLVTIAADQLGNEQYNAATTVMQTIEVLKGNQIILIEDIADKVFGDAPFTVTASSDTGLGIDLAITSGPATIVDNMVTITGAGEIVIAASQAGNENYNVASANTAVTVAKADQVITIEDVADKVFGDAPFTVTASSDAELGIDLTITSGPATIADNMVTITGSGEIVIAASQAGNENYNAASASITVIVVKADQVITIEDIADKVFGDDPFTVTASSDSGLEIDLAITSGPATITDNTVTITGAGEIVITASQVGSDNYNAASANITVTVAKADQVITIEEVSAKVFGDEPFTITASSGSGLEIDFAITSGPATVTDNTVTITGAGEIVIAASQAGSDNYNATSASITITVAKADQAITFTAIDPKTIEGAPFAPAITASSGLEVTLEVVSGPATVSEGTITLTGTLGTVTVRAIQAGDDNYNAATAVEQSFEVTLVTSIEPDPVLQDINLYPNPASDQVTISLKNMGLHQFKTLSLTDINGTVFNTISLKSNQQELTIDVSSLQEGLYLVLVHSDKGTFTKKVMKQN